MFTFKAAVDGCRFTVDVSSVVLWGFSLVPFFPLVRFVI